MAVRSCPAHTACAAVGIDQISALTIWRARHRSTLVNVDLAIETIPSVSAGTQVLTRANQPVGATRLHAFGAIQAQISTACTFVNIHFAAVAAEARRTDAVEVACWYASIG